MPYSKFTLSKAVEDFNLTIVEGARFFPEIAPVTPSLLLQDTLKETIPWAIAVSSEKARSEGIINPVLLEVKRQLQGQISVFSGEEFNVEPEAELTGYVDFLLSRSPEQLFIKAPAVVLVEAKKEDLKPGLGQCLAEMVAAQRFNQQKQQPISTIYGTVTSGTVWRFLKLEEQCVSIDLTDYSLLPVEQILGFLVWMMTENC
ncbi:MAG: hypothetical protein JGK24_02740 [Microcoleus sp. PH2017_29_MFU_D_A]|uniref:hypothetical protein n=1 Tax=unclassified Microcoleus TaxID=2642155 RepID=UPI001D7D99B0|nr:MULTISPECIES: hypothetical protein [unclassified Microcoleus]MCC3417670.1 hypothetical protein [Microcoleus sp. PH2017_07_MST_O_A]MCC3432217.1 hypothetical protein [Microcoleus sp. PH2017_04_SCI_O_A]MCC3444755.1 hypothetical protein [Microcoleus sp. PH2017_03_ELD_O_A]MCC3464729.1 hypothetical protein [Microcoleus sp. PH2017_06_SFM_O_A]MCC3501774.1 hypothetical protein [Microcoleus sp. PH2017_19_SFW_U_A]MCC3512568.1 hypothetical protein [Microcoleus sp. PH2017_17_BER_D_A]TAE11111.1 MAG: hy